MLRTKSLRRKSRSARFEPLERRQMMAGDVTVSLSNGALLITGDVGANAIEISSSNGDIRVDGVLDGNGVATTINGGAGQTFSGVSGNVVIELGDGDDAVTVQTLFLGGALVVNAGAGNDTVSLAVDPGTVVSTARELIFNMGDGDDVVKIHNAYIATSVIVNGGAGVDQFVAGFKPDNSDGQFSTVADLAINLGQDYGDSVWLNRSTIGRYFRSEAAELVNLRYSSAANVAAIFSGSTNLNVGIDGSFFGTDFIVTSATDLGLSLAGAIVTNNAFVSSTGKIHGLAVASSIIDTLNLIGSSQADENISLTYSMLNQLFADLGEGANAMSMAGNSVRGTSWVNLGPQGRGSSAGDSFAGGQRPF